MHLDFECCKGSSQNETFVGCDWTLGWVQLDNNSTGRHGTPTHSGCQSRTIQQKDFDPASDFAAAVQDMIDSAVFYHLVSFLNMDLVFKQAFVACASPVH